MLVVEWDHGEWHEEVGEIGQWRAESREFPVENTDNAALCRMEDLHQLQKDRATHQVVHLVISVNDRSAMSSLTADFTRIVLKPGLELFGAENVADDTAWEGRTRRLGLTR